MSRRFHWDLSSCFQRLWSYWSSRWLQLKSDSWPLEKSVFSGARIIQKRGQVNQTSWQSLVNRVFYGLGQASAEPNCGVETSILSKLSSQQLQKSALFHGNHFLQNFACSTHFTENRSRRCENTDGQKRLLQKIHSCLSLNHPHCTSLSLVLKLSSYNKNLLLAPSSHPLEPLKP